MNSLVAFHAVASWALRWLFLSAAVLVAVVCLLDWLARTRRISPFSAVARFMRERVDPLMVPVERRVLRAGGSPASAPWWMLAAVVVSGIVVLSLLDFAFGQLVQAGAALAGGPRGVIALVVSWAFALLQIALIVRVISSWVGGSAYSPWWRWSYVLTEPILAPLRRIVPSLGPIDITPIVAYVLLRLAGGLVLSLIV